MGERVEEQRLSVGGVRRVFMATGKGPVEVDAEVYGVWALTPRNTENGPDTDWWAFTHVPTGRSFGRAAFAAKADVREFVKLLAREFSDGAWLESDPNKLSDGLTDAEKWRFKLLYNEFRFGDAFADGGA